LDVDVLRTTHDDDLDTPEPSVERGRDWHRISFGACVIARRCCLVDTPAKAKSNKSAPPPSMPGRSLGLHDRHGLISICAQACRPRRRRRAQ
jgi:hypothetical protein